MNKQNSWLVGSLSSSFCIAINVFPSPYVIWSEATRVQEKSGKDNVIIPVPYTTVNYRRICSLWEANVFSDVCVHRRRGGSGGYKGGAPSPDPNSFDFMQFLEKFGKIVCWRLPPPRGLALPPRGNPGSTTGRVLCPLHMMPLISHRSHGPAQTCSFGTLPLLYYMRTHSVRVRKGRRHCCSRDGKTVKYLMIYLS